MNELEKEALIQVRRGCCRSRAELARRLGISRPTASVAVAALLHSGTLCETGRGKSRRGKAPTLLAPVAESIRTIGIDLGYTSRLAGVLADGTGAIVRNYECPCDTTRLPELERGMRRLLAELNGGTVRGIGLALPAILDPTERFVHKSVNPLLTRCDLRELVSRWSGLPCAIGNRSRLAAFSEAYGGAADQEPNFILLSLGRSIGAAFWVNGAVWRGSHSAAGEIRNLRLADGTTLEEALAPCAVAALPPEALAERCIQGIGQLAEIMDMELLILAGRFSDFGSGFAPMLEAGLASRLPCRIRASKFGRAGAARGAASLIAEEAIRSEL